MRARVNESQEFTNKKQNIIIIKSSSQYRIVHFSKIIDWITLRNFLPIHIGIGILVYLDDSRTNYYYFDNKENILVAMKRNIISCDKFNVSKKK